MMIQMSTLYPKTVEESPQEPYAPVGATSLMMIASTAILKLLKDCKVANHFSTNKIAKDLK